MSCGLALALAGCGGGAASSSTTGSGDSTSALAFAQCMRSHGVPNFPDPGTGRSVNAAPGSGLDPAAPAFQSAQSTCNKLVPGGGPRSGPAPAPSASDLHAALVWAECLRKHGVPDFPDPSTSGNQGLFFRGIVFAVRPGFNPQAPAFKQAQAACGFGPLGGKR